uniref:Calponin n=1 Tax=Equus asinus asinus TaxID=83772 RepID=A0A8C4PQF2_EQUAS
MTHFNKGPSYGLSAEVKNKIASKYDHQAEEDLRNWIEEVTGMSIGTNFQLVLALMWPFCSSRFHTTIDVGVKYAEKQTRRFDEGKLKAGQSVIGLQMGTNKCASQAGMTAYGTRRHLYDPKMQTDKPFDQTTISLQMGTNKGASQAGMLAPGTRRDIYDQKLTLQPVDNSTISLQMGTNKVASQKGMSVYGLGRQVYDPKYCAAPTEPVIHNGSQGTGTNGSEISDSDYQAEYPDEYHGEYQDDYPRDYQYGDQGIDY